MLRVVFADSGTKEDLQQTLGTNRARMDTALRDQVVEQCRGYLQGGGPFPDRLHLIGLFSDFYLRFAELVDAWTADALAEIDQWDSTKRVGMTAHARRTFERVLARYDSTEPIDRPD